MRERVGKFEGNGNIESGASGTRITVTIPVPPVQESAATREEPQAAV